MAALLDESGAPLLDEAGAGLLDESAGLAFPLSPLDLQVELDLGGWTDITSWNLQRDGSSPPVSITAGRPNEQASATPLQLSTEWNNRDGRFSPRNPTGPFYGLLGRNTPLRVSVPAALNYLRIADDAVSGASCPGSSALKLTGDIDVRIDLDLDNWVPCFLAGQWSAGAHCWALSLNGDGTVMFTWYDGTSTNQVSSTMPAPLGRSMIRAYFDPAGTSGSAQVLFYTAPSMGGTQVQLGSAVAIATADYAHSAVTPLLAGYSAEWAAGMLQGGLQGSVYELRVYSAGTLEASPLFSAQADGTVSLTDGQGNAWAMSGSAQVSGRCYRAHAECAALPQRWDSTGRDVWTPVAAAGVLQRLQQGSSPGVSAMRSTMGGLTGAWGIAAYWPAEDPQGATQLASALPGGNPMAFSGSPGFQGTAGSPSADSQFACSAQLPQVQSSTWYGRVPVTAAARLAAQSSVTLLLSVPSGGFGSAQTLLQVNEAGAPVPVYVTYAAASGGTLGLSYGSAATTPAMTGVNGQAMWVQVVIGGSPLYDITLAVLPAGSEEASVTVYSGASGSPVISSVIVNPGGAALGAAEAGHVTVAYGDFGQLALAPAAAPGLPGGMPLTLTAYLGETAAARVVRLCAENGIAGRVYGYPDLSMPMGQQPVDTFANQLQYSEASDLGQVYEPLEALGIGYRTLGSLCNQDPGLLLDYAAGQLGDGESDLEPTDDDQYSINDVTAQRNGGSSARVQVTTGPMSIQPPPDGIGDYATQISPYNAWDGDLPGIAGWAAHTGSCDEERYAAIPLHLARAEVASLVDDITALRLGDYFRIANMPAWMPPGPVRQLAYGWEEDLGGFHWYFKPNAVPESPYETARAGVAKAAPAGSQLAAGISAAATVLTVQVTAGQAWSALSGDDPFDILIAGEQMTVTAVTSPTGGGQQDFTVTRSVNGVVKAQPAVSPAGGPVPVVLFSAPVAALAGNR